MSSSAPMRESSPEKRPDEEVQLYVAIDLLGLGSMQVIRLCKSGALRARRNKHGTWWLDKAFLLRWHEANPNYAAATECESSADEERNAPPPTISALTAMQPCPPGACEGHWERRGRFVPAYRANLCLSCYSGRPLPVKIDLDAI